jgi:hypothetical protein
MTSRRGARNAKKVKKNIFEKSRRYNGDYGMFKVSGVQPEGCLYRV